jgi:hypothetical protein
MIGLDDSYCEPKFNIQTATGSISHNPPKYPKSESLQETMESEQSLTQLIEPAPQSLGSNTLDFYMMKEQ